MSSDNYIEINEDTFEVRDKCASCPEHEGSLIGKGKTLEEAIKISKEIESEYGIYFIKNLPKNK